MIKQRILMLLVVLLSAGCESALEIEKVNLDCDLPLGKIKPFFSNDGILVIRDRIEYQKFRQVASNLETQETLGELCKFPEIDFLNSAFLGVFSVVYGASDGYTFVKVKFREERKWVNVEIVPTVEEEGESFEIQMQFFVVKDFPSDIRGISAVRY